MNKRKMERRKEKNEEEKRGNLNKCFVSLYHILKRNSMLPVKTNNCLRDLISIQTVLQ
jgi:hypothetical protein